MTIWYQNLTIQPPQNRAKKEQLNPIELQVVLVRESQPPSEPSVIEWWLVRWYSYRWLIERYHYVLKSGCAIYSVCPKCAIGKNPDRHRANSLKEEDID
ncbi:hypothetical protein QUA81_31735 [Microcoleus sp. F6_B4]